MGNMSQVLRAIQSVDDINEKVVYTTIRNLLEIDEPKNVKEYILNIQKKFNDLESLLYYCGDRILLKQKNINEKEYTPLEVAKIIGVTKGAIFNHIKKNHIEVKQEMKNGNIKIVPANMDLFCKKYPKYKDAWESRY